MTDDTVFFVTNRNYQPDNKLMVFGPRFNPDGVAGLRFGRARFSAGSEGPVLTDTFVYPETKTGETFKVQGSASFLDDMKAAMAAPSRDTLVFIHGFNVSFRGALAAGARLARQVRVDGRPMNVVVFSWPSDGEAVPLMSYYSDREDARASGAAVARAFLKLRDYVSGMPEADYCNQRIHLLAHSMGNYVLRQGLQALKGKDERNLVRLFDQILMAAPDEDDDAFEDDRKLRLLPRIGRQVTVYFNPEDRALLISDKSKANPDRLGSDGPRMIDLLPKKVTLVDCRNVGRTGDAMSRHSYYVGSPAMSRDLGAVLNGEEPTLIANRAWIDADRAWRLVKEL
ncbi:MAG: alpha/beta fold hydrolase [Pseudomonadota bacterium]